MKLYKIKINDLIQIEPDYTTNSKLLHNGSMYNRLNDSDIIYHGHDDKNKLDIFEVSLNAKMFDDDIFYKIKNKLSLDQSDYAKIKKLIKSTCPKLFESINNDYDINLNYISYKPTHDAILIKFTIPSDTYDLHEIDKPLTFENFDAPSVKYINERLNKKLNAESNLSKSIIFKYKINSFKSLLNRILNYNDLHFESKFIYNADKSNEEYDVYSIIDVKKFKYDVNQDEPAESNNIDGIISELNNIYGENNITIKSKSPARESDLNRQPSKPDKVVKQYFGEEGDQYEWTQTYNTPDDPIDFIDDITLQIIVCRIDPVKFGPWLKYKGIEENANRKTFEKLIAAHQFKIASVRHAIEEGYGIVYKQFKLEDHYPPLMEKLKNDSQFNKIYYSKETLYTSAELIDYLKSKLNQAKKSNTNNRALANEELKLINSSIKDMLSENFVENYDKYNIVKNALMHYEAYRIFDDNTVDELIYKIDKSLSESNETDVGIRYSKLEKPVENLNLIDLLSSDIYKQTLKPYAHESNQDGKVLAAKLIKKATNDHTLFDYVKNLDNNPKLTPDDKYIKKYQLRYNTYIKKELLKIVEPKYNDAIKSVEEAYQNYSSSSSDSNADLLQNLIDCYKRYVRFKSAYTVIRNY